LIIACPELQTRLGQKYCDEAGLLALLLAHGIVRQRVRIIEVTVQPLGGDKFTIKLNAAGPSVGEAKARTQGIPEARQELYKVAARADGSAVREDNAEPEAMDGNTGITMKLWQSVVGNRQIMSIPVKEPPLVWRTCIEEEVTLSEDGAVATTIATYEPPLVWRTCIEEEVTLSEDENSFGYGYDSSTLVTSGVELTAGKHYWAVEILSSGNPMDGVGNIRLRVVPAVWGSTPNWRMAKLVIGKKANGTQQWQGRFSA
jgi:hypothetical protein